MKLFDNAASPYSFKVRATLYEKGIDVEKNEIWSESQRQELLRVSPRGEVPALHDGDRVIYDSTVICEYLEERHPAPPLLPSDPAGRAKCRALEKICDTQVDACVFVIGVYKVFRPGLDGQFSGLAAQAEATLKKHYANFDRELNGAEYFAGGAFSRADIALAPHLAAASFMGYPVGEEYASLARWVTRVNSRPAIQQATQEAFAAYEQAEKESRPFFDRNRLHWRNDRIEWALRFGLGRWLVDEVASGGAFFSPVP